MLIEDSLGRTRDGLYSPRTVDIDILYFNDKIIEDKMLTIPHPRISERKFVLTPMNEIAKMHYDPVVKLTMNEMLAICQDHLSVLLYK